jgi:endonuclease/exonuclease/phosphatase (EEP) superfamily protein YafD
MHRNKWVRSMAAVVCVGLLLLTVIAWLSSLYGWSYWLERLSHFQLQYWLVAAGLTLVLLVLRQRGPLLVGLFCLALLSVNIVTWYIPSTGQTTPLVKVMFANVWIYNQRYGDAVAAVRSEQPDLVGFSEVDGRWVQELDKLRDILPYRIEHRDSTILYSKIDLASTEIISGYPLLPNTAIVRNLRKAGQTFTVVVTHPQSPRSPEALQGRNYHLNLLAAYLAKSQDNLIAIGDFNISPWSPYYRKFVGEAGLLNARQGSGIYPTWTNNRVRRLPEFLQSFLSIPIDHAFTKSGKVKLRATSFQSLPDVGSDHLPIVAEIGTVNP